MDVIEKKHSKEIKQGVILNYLFIALLTLSSFILTPMISSKLGLSLFGVYALVFSIVSFFRAADFGIALPVIQNIVELNVKGEKKRLETYLFKTLLIYFSLAAAVFCVCLGIYSLSPLIFGDRLSVYETEIFKQMFLIMSAEAALSFIANYLFGIIIAHDKLVFTRVCNIAKTVVRAVLLIFIITGSFEPYVVFFADLTVTIMLICAYICYVFAVLKIRIRYAKDENSPVKQTFSSMMMSYAMFMSENAYGAAAPVIIAAGLGSGDVSRFYISFTFITIYIQLSATLSHLRIPKLSELWCEHGETERFSEYLMSSAKLQTAVLGLILTGFIILGKPFLLIWIGADFNASYLLALLMMTAIFFPLSQSMPDVALYARKKYGIRTIVQLSSAVTGIVLTLAGVKYFGLTGAGLAYLVTTLSLNFGVMNIYFGKIYSIMRRFNTEIILKFIPPIAVSAAAGYFIAYIGNGSLLFAALGALAGLGLYAAIVWFTAFRKSS